MESVADSYDFRFLTVLWEDIGVHPGFTISEAVGWSGVSFCGNGVGGDVELDVISIVAQTEDRGDG